MFCFCAGILKNYIYIYSPCAANCPIHLEYKMRRVCVWVENAELKFLYAYRANLRNKSPASIRYENFQQKSWNQSFLMLKLTQFLLISACFEMLWCKFTCFSSFFNHFQIFWWKCVLMPDPCNHSFKSHYSEIVLTKMFTMYISLGVYCAPSWNLASSEDRFLTGFQSGQILLWTNYM